MASLETSFKSKFSIFSAILMCRQSISQTATMATCRLASYRRSAEDDTGFDNRHRKIPCKLPRAHIRELRY
ncbi:hypothetical protein K440DRAFT_98574 [Wilcoxina mikolae CBS 423.85]|nr:hypothetical protein K440DRAFT_98574 [Wilcoxina mikolae CBS 423.85]